MGLTLTEKIIKAHIIDGEMVKGTEIGLKIDQTLTQDATGTMAYLQFEAMGVDRVKTERSVAYIDHNTLQSGFEPTTTDLSVLLQRSTVSGSHVPATVSAIRYILSASASPARPLSAPTATPRPAAVSACWQWAQAVLTLQLQWAAALTT